MTTTGLRCSVCGTPLASDDIDEALCVAHCPKCKAMFDIRGRKGAALQDRKQGPPRTRVRAPPGVEVDERPDGVTIGWRWYSPGAWVVAIVAGGWNALVLSGVKGTWRSGGGAVIALAFGGAVGLALAYVALACFFNRTRVTVNRQWLRIRRGPLPWPAQLDIAGPELTQLYGKQVVTRHRVNDDPFGTSKSHGSRPTRVVQSTTYSLCATDRHGRERIVMHDIAEASFILWMEQVMERHLGLEDEPVAGELKA